MQRGTEGIRWLHNNGKSGPNLNFDHKVGPAVTQFTI